MNAPTFSVLHASYGRPEKGVAAMRNVLAKADNPHLVQYIACLNDDDPATMVAFDSLATFIAFGPYKGSAEAWDVGARVSSGDILVQMQDDLELPQSWDNILLENLETMNVDPLWWREHPVVVAVGDGHRKDKLLCTAIINRKRYEQVGEFIHAGYLSVYSDGEFTYRAIRDDRDGKCALLKTDVVFEHRHHYHDKSVPLDLTYKRENSPQAYAQGFKLFNERNPGWRATGIVDWM